MKALLAINLQRDFCTEGALPVPRADEIIPIINELFPKFDLIIFIKDWHPQNHKSFVSQHSSNSELVLWPDHCIQDTLGARLHPAIYFSKCKKDFYIFKKGVEKDSNGYSAFEDKELDKFLNEKKVTDIFITGLAGDYSCKETAIDAAMLGYKTTYIIDAIRFINEDKAQTVKDITDANVKIIESWELPLFNLIK